MRMRALIALGAVVAGIGVSAAQAEDSLEGTSWLLEVLGGKAWSGASAAGGTTPTLSFVGGRIAGTDGCNQYVAPATAAGGMFRVDAGRMAGTMRACPEPVMELATEFRSAVSSATAYRLAEGRLRLTGAGGAPLAEFSAQPAALEGTVWEVTAVNNGKQAVVSVALGTTLSAAFTEGGRMSGSAGCNRFTGTYSVQGAKISIGKLAATRRMCVEPAGIMEQEAQFLRALESAATCRFDGDLLELRAESGALAVKLRRSGM
jgi:heat shock protein HslJ